MILRGDEILGLQRNPGDTMQQRDDGTWEGTVKYTCRWINVINLAPRRNVAHHPDFNALVCKSCNIIRLKPGLLCELVVVYRGIFTQEGDPEPPDLPNSTEEIITSTSEASIETHPAFVSSLGGTKGSELNGAVFDKDGLFKGWTADSQYAGKESYLIPSTIYRKNTPSRSRPNSVGAVGQLTVQPGVGHDVPGGNWLFSCRTWRRDGGVYDVTEEWMLSGPGGWDSSIY